MPIKDTRSAGRFIRGIEQTISNIDTGKYVGKGVCKNGDNLIQLTL